MLRSDPLGALLAAALALFNLDSGKEETSREVGDGEEVSRTVTIRNNRGGHVIDYVQQLEQWKQSGTQVRFVGRCDSACTLYLALPESNTCIARNASFRFHAPRGGTPQINRVMETYMTQSYPDWVRVWLEHRGGLKRQVITMDYRYASRFMRPCTGAAASTNREG
jgi:hypothetical protein